MGLFNLKKTNFLMIKDFVLNIIASFILTGVTQLIVYPFFSRSMPSTDYGIMLTIMGVVNAVGGSLGNPLNNTRILMQPQYDQREINGDYNIIFIGLVPITFFTVFIISSSLYGRFSIESIGIAFTAVLVLFRAYYCASYRIIIDFKKILYSNLISAIGYIVGIIISLYLKSWIYTFLLGELFASIYIAMTSHILLDKIKVTKLFKSSFNRYLLIMSSTLISMVITYMDRFIIFPLLGAEKVAIYNVASFLGKMVGIVMTPISGVLLTYYAKEKQLSIKKFYIRTGIFFLISLIIFIGIVTIGKPITIILYPTIANEALKYFVVANLASITYMLGNTIMPILLRFCNAKWQPIIQIIHIVFYLGLGYVGIAKGGILGFCYATLLVNFIRVVMLVLIASLSLYTKGVEKIND